MSKNINQRKLNKTKLAKNLGIARSSLYYKPILPVKDLALSKDIQAVMSVHTAYGYRRIAMHLGINKKRILRVMKLFNLSPIRKIKKPVKKNDLNQEIFKIKNLADNVTINKPSQIWASDFTYLPYFNNTNDSITYKKFRIHTDSFGSRLLFIANVVLICINNI